MNSLADRLPPEIARQIHPDWRKNEAGYWDARDQILAQYNGQWIGFADGAVIASGTSPVAVFHAADYARADSLLATFAVDFPSDPRCEDAAFLRAVACWRLGDKSGAAKHAKAYLDAYPNGLRRVEARRMIDARDALP